MKEEDQQIVVINDQVPMKSNLLMPRESIFIYRTEDLLREKGLSSSAASQKLLQQFNLDFDRQTVIINGKKCRHRCSFFRKVTEIVRRQCEMDLLLLLCQQTILAHALQNVQEMLSSHRVPYLIKDSGSCTTITLDATKKSKKATSYQDFEVKVKKQMYLVDHFDPELVVNVFDITINLSSLKSSGTQEVQISVKFQWPIGKNPDN